MFDIKQLHYLCTKYKIKYKIFESTNTIYLDSNLEEWLVKYIYNKDKPFCLMHKNKIRQTNKFHVQGYKRTLTHLIDSILTHKKVLVKIHGSPGNTYKNYKYKNNKRRSKV